MKPYPMKKVILIVIPLIGLLALLSGCQNKSADANASAAPPPPAVTVSRPVVKDVVHHAEFSGTTEAAESVIIRARVEGYLEKIHFTEGAMVKDGDLLFSIDDQPYQATLDEAKALLAMAQAESHQARATMTRKENALRDRAVSEVAVIDARAHLGKAEAKEEWEKLEGRWDRIRGRLFIVRNGRVEPTWASVDRRTFSITTRAHDSMQYEAEFCWGGGVSFK